MKWIPEQGDPVNVQWQSQASQEDENLTIVDAAEYLQNPFYMIPFYHLIQYKDDFAQALDLRVVSSQPSRIEIYDQNDKIVAVDAEGDGLTTGDDDMVAQDFNQNGTPDLKLQKNQNENRFRFFVSPHGKIPKEGLTLSLEIKFEGKWVQVSEDRLLAR